MDTPSTVTLIHECPYWRICSDNAIRYGTCAENPKRSYYRPIDSYPPYTNYFFTTYSSLPVSTSWGTGVYYPSPPDGGTNAICH